VNEEVLEATYLASIRTLVDSAEEVVETVRDGAELALEPENKAALDRIQIRNEGIVVEFKCGVAIEQEYVK
jgi:hypothetical protein